MSHHGLERINPIVLKKLETLVSNPLHMDYTSSAGKMRTAQQFLNLGDVLKSNVPNYETFAVCLFFFVSQSRAIDWNTASSNFTPGVMQFSTFQVILPNDSYVPLVEMALYQNLKLATGEYHRIIDADTENQVKNKRTFVNATVRGVHVFDEYVIVEFQACEITNEASEFGNDNAKGGNNVSQYNLIAGVNKK